MTLWLAALALAADPTPDWQAAETCLRNTRQVTSGFIRAGEGYFSPDGRTIIFQAEEADRGNPFYQIFVQDLTAGQFRRVSPGVGKTTCAYYRPDGKRIIFASTHLDPEAKAKYAPEYQTRQDDQAKGVRRRYSWDFDPAMDIFESNPDGSDLKRITQAEGYDAEGSYSSDGKQIVFCSKRTGSLELWIMNADGTVARQLTHAPNCYNGGPFFSPDGRRVVFRSDRKEKDRLQLYVINADGTGERCIADKPNWVCWGPYWHPDGKHVIYSGADHGTGGRPNYDLYWLNVDTGREVRITHAPGADVLPAFNADGTKLLWTSTRDGRQPSQLYMADFTPPRDESRKPAAAPEDLRRMIGLYAREGETLTVFEQGGRLQAQLGATTPVPADHVTFSPGAAGIAAAAKIGDATYQRRPLPGEGAPAFRIQPVRSVAELIKAARQSSPPATGGEFATPDLVDLQHLDPTIRLDIRYATADNFLGVPVYPEARAFLQRPAAEAVLRAHRSLAGDGLGLLIHDAYRPWHVTKVFWDATPAHQHQFVADPAIGSRHNRGCAVDLTLYELATGRAVSMPSGYDEFSERAFPNYVGGTSLERWHRDRLRRAMEAQGFTVFEAEWWHFDYQDWKKYPVMNVPFAGLGQQ